MKTSFNTKWNPAEPLSELDAFEGVQLDGLSDFEPDVGSFYPQLSEAWEGEIRRGKRIPISGLGFRRRRVRPAPPPGKWPPFPPRPPKPPRSRPILIVREPQTLDYPSDGAEYVRWVQISLNRIMGLRLSVNGIMGPETRSAIRSFQVQKGLPGTGIVGPDTERALIAAGTGRSSKTGELEASDIEIGDQEGQAEVNRKSPGYIRWVQQSLNKILGLRLVVDGMMGSQTRSAIRSFQSLQGLKADGIVGPKTEAALVASGVDQLQRRSAAFPAFTAPAFFQPLSQSQADRLRNKIVRVADTEWRLWSKGSIKESNPSIRSRLQDYWMSGVGFVPSQPDWWSSVPWSAAFISWVMRKAGVGKAFRYSAGHSNYIVDAKNNRMANNDNPFQAYRITEIPPQPGDLVCKSRAGSGANYDNIRPGMATHCDIVTAIQPGRLLTIGGSVNNSVSMTYVPINQKNLIIAPKYFAVIRIAARKNLNLELNPYSIQWARL